jgi:hypothetical protein
MSDLSIDRPAAIAKAKVEPGMTPTERRMLRDLVLLRAQVAKHDAENRGAWLLADAEAKLATIFKAEDEAWADVMSAARQGVNEVNARIAKVCDARGVPKEFRPSLNTYWMDRGESGYSKRRAELRQVAQTQVAAQVKEAKLEIDREVERQLTQLAASGITSAAAQDFLGSMPGAEELLPAIGVLELPSGEVLALEEPRPVTPAVTDGEPGRNAVTADHNACVTCGKEVSDGRGRYCSSACRQAAYRKRKST